MCNNVFCYMFADLCRTEVTQRRMLEPLEGWTSSPYKNLIAVYRANTYAERGTPFNKLDTSTSGDTEFSTYIEEKMSEVLADEAATAIIRNATIGLKGFATFDGTFVNRDPYVIYLSHICFLLISTGWLVRSSQCNCLSVRLSHFWSSLNLEIEVSNLKSTFILSC